MVDNISYRKTRADGSGEEYGEPKFTGASKIDQSYGAYMGKPQQAHLGSQSAAPGKEDEDNSLAGMGPG